MEEQIQEILQFMEEEKFAPEDVIITEGKPNDRLYFIIEGQVAASKKDVVLARFSEGDVFGEMEILDVMPAVASIKAVTQVTTMTISNKSMREIYKKDIIIFTLVLMNLARDLVRRLRKMDEKITSSSSPVFF
jgi:CRP-like cAMP-binding protein